MYVDPCASFAAGRPNSRRSSSRRERSGHGRCLPNPSLPPRSWVDRLIMPNLKSESLRHLPLGNWHT